MNEEEKENIENLKSFLYTDTITQYGKRKLIKIYEEVIEKQQKEIEELKEDLETEQNEHLLCQIRNRKEIEELKEKLFKKNSLVVVNRIEEKLEEIDKDYIPKSKIEEKIKECDYKIHKAKEKYGSDYMNYEDYYEAYKERELYKKILEEE